MRTSIQPYGKTVQRHLSGSDAEYPPSCLPSHLLQQYDEVGQESKGTPVSDGDDIGATLNTYTHLGLEDVVDELKRVEELENAKKEIY